MRKRTQCRALAHRHRASPAQTPRVREPGNKTGQMAATTASTLLPAKYSYGAMPYAYATMLITEGSSERLAEHSY